MKAEMNFDNIGGGGSTTFDIDQKNCRYSPVTFSGVTNAYVCVGSKADRYNGAADNLIFYIDNGSQPQIVTDREFYNYSYNNGTISVVYDNSTAEEFCWVRIMYN